MVLCKNEENETKGVHFFIILVLSTNKNDMVLCKNKENETKGVHFLLY